MNQSKHGQEQKTAGENTQSQGGVRLDELDGGRDEARSNIDPASGGEGGHLGVSVPGQSLDEGGDEDESGFTGDDAGYVSTNTVSEPGELEPWQAAKRAQDQLGRSDSNLRSRDLTDRPATDDIGEPADGSAPTAAEQDLDSESSEPQPHRGLDAQGDADDVDQEDASTGEGYQTGGTRTDRSQKVHERKAQEGTSAPPPSEQGGPGTSPGTPLGKDRDR